MRSATEYQLQVRLSYWREEMRTNRHGYAILALLSIEAITKMLKDL